MRRALLAAAQCRSQAAVQLAAGKQTLQAQCWQQQVRVLGQQQQAPALDTAVPTPVAPWWTCLSGVRHMAGRTHRLSLKAANNRASWLAARPFIEQQPLEQQQQRRRSAKPPPIESAIPPLPQLQLPPEQHTIGRITGPYAVQRAPAFAVLESGGAQFKVTPDDVIYHNKIPGASVNDVIEFGRVLLLGSAAETVVGRPHVPGASVVAVVEEVFRDAKVHVFKKKKRKRYSKLQGHRSHVTMLRIVELRGSGAAQQQQAAPALRPLRPSAAPLVAPPSVRPRRVPAAAGLAGVVTAS